MADRIDDQTTIRALLQLAEVTPTDDEIGALAAGLGPTRQMIDSLHRMPGVRYAEPATIFDARP
jgi:hypothetical protein